MNTFSDSNGPDLHNQIPRCLGRVINAFDLGVGMTGPKLLTENTHRDGSPTRRGQPHVAKKASGPVEGHLEGKRLHQESKRSFQNKKSNGMLVKMLIAQDMSKEMGSCRKPPNVVARLMGLDALPAQQLTLNARRALPEGCMRNCYTIGEAIQSCQQQGDVYTQRMLPQNFQSFYNEKCEPREYKDVHEVWQQPARTNHSKSGSLSGERFNENSNENRIALVRQKFMEAKRLATNQKLLDSKEFQDALEVLSSNRDLFLKFLEEPTSQFSKHLHALQATSQSTLTKCITVLKPSKALGAEAEQHLKKDQLAAELCKRNSSRGGLFHAKSECLSQPTRIVVLKPSPGKSYDARTVFPSPASSQRLCEGVDSFAEQESTEIRESREVAKEITRQMRESLSSNRRDETLLSSVLSNGYNGDESSVNEFMEEEYCNFSDSQIVTPTSRHSWDYISRIDSPHSVSSTSRASYSPESSVIREAKKRLSERLAMVTSGETSQEKRPVRRNSSTLGEMLAAPDIKKNISRDESSVVRNSKSYGGEHDQKMASCLSNVGSLDENSGNSSPNILQRSKSVPTSPVYGSIEVKTLGSGSQFGASVVSKELPKLKSVKSSLKGKVSSFFSRNKKYSPEKIISAPSAGPCNVSACNGHGDTNSSDNFSFSVADNSCEEDMADAMEVAKSGRIFTLEQGCLERDTPIIQEMPSFSNTSESLEQPSPVSVLEAQFDEDTSTSSSLSREGEGSGTISRSPLIESVARSLSWEDDAYSEKIFSNPKKSPSNLFKSATEEQQEEQECITIVQALLSSSGLRSSVPSRILDGWHSLESPLNPSLLDKFLDPKEEGAKCRERRSNQRLLFDCVNAALLKISHHDAFDTCPWPIRVFLRAHNSEMTLTADEVLRHIKEWSLESEKWASGYNGNSRVWVELIIKRDIGGSQWEETMSSEIAEMGMEIEGQVLEELVSETLDGFFVSLLQ